MSITIHQLRCFLAVAQSGSFRRCAEHMHLSPSSVSEQIAQLETQVGSRVFDRVPGGAVLTPSGRALMPLAERVACAMDEVQAWSRGGGDRVRIGMMVAHPRISALVATAAREDPSIQWEVRQLGFVDSRAALERHDVDCAFSAEIGTAPDSDLVAFPLWDEECVLVVGRDHALAGRDSVSLADLAGQTLIGIEDAEASARWLAAVARGPGAAPRLLPVARTFEEVLEMCSAGLGVNIAGASARELYSRPGLRFLPIEDAPRATMHLCLRPGPRSAALDGFVRLARRPWTGDVVS